MELTTKEIIEHLNAAISCFNKAKKQIIAADLPTDHIGAGINALEDIMGNYILEQRFRVTLSYRVGSDPFQWAGDGDLALSLKDGKISAAIENCPASFGVETDEIYAAIEASIEQPEPWTEEELLSIWEELGGGLPEKCPNCGGKLNRFGVQEALSETSADPEDVNVFCSNYDPETGVCDGDPKRDDGSYYWETIR